MKFENLAGLFNCASSNRGIIRLNLDEAALLWRGVQKADSIVGPILEVGRRFGGSTQLIAAASREGVKDIISVDLKMEVHEKVRKYLLLNDRVELRVGSSFAPIDRDWSFIFIDGDHSYEGASTDMKIHVPRLVPGGYLAVHDAVEGAYGCCPGVAQACKELEQTGTVEKIEVAESMILYKKR